MFKAPETASQFPASATPPDPTAAMAAACNRCGTCQARCSFLKANGKPGEIAEAYTGLPQDDIQLRLAFECSLCGLCTAVCPKSLSPSNMFLHLRQAAVSHGTADLKRYHRILGYEKKGCSSTFSFYSLPRGCTTVFFPGCTLSGTRPENTLKTYEYLRGQDPATGIVLDCCTKPSHDLGRQADFESKFFEMTDYLKANGITSVVTACPSCHRIFEDHSPFRVVSVYGLLAETPVNTIGKFGEKQAIVVQDPCQARFDRSTQEAVRVIAAHMGLGVKTVRNAGEKTLCCGEGGSASCMNPDRGTAWAAGRKDAAKGLPAMTYCAGCVNFLGTNSMEIGLRNFHILDLVFDGAATLSGNARVAKAPFTYLNRLRLKKRLKTLPAAVTRERPAEPGRTVSQRMSRVFFSLLAGIGLI